MPGLRLPTPSGLGGGLGRADGGAVEVETDGLHVGELAAFLRIHLPQLDEQAADDLAIDLGFARGIRCCPMPLRDSAGARERAGFLGDAVGRQHDHFGLDVLGLDVVRVAVVLPKLSGLGAQWVDDDQVLQF